MLFLVFVVSGCARSTDDDQEASTADAADALAFASERTDDSDISITSGGRATVVTRSAALDGNPAWSPDGRTIAFDTNRHDPNARAFELYVADVARSMETRLTRNAVDDFDPDWSPDGKRLVFTSIRNGNEDVYVMPAVPGASASRLTTSRAADEEPAWSPDGRSIAFASRRDGDWDIYVMDPAGREERRVIQTRSDEGAPAWSPDGRRLAFWSDVSGGEDVYTADADGGDLGRVTTDPGADVDPTWSPDGAQIAFAGERAGNFDVYVVGTDGSELRRLTREAAFDSAPDWSPRPPPVSEPPVSPRAAAGEPQEAPATPPRSALARPRLRFSYNDAWTGWPVAPLHRQHPVRGSFLEPRRAYHFGIDINVRDDRPAPSAPAGRTHGVYAVEGGSAAAVVDGGSSTCFSRRLMVGHFSYWHVDPVVAAGERVAPGQLIGWTCEGWWHVHLSEWTRVGGRRVWVNPLHRGGKLRPYVDSAKPVIRAIRFFTPGISEWTSTPQAATFLPPAGRALPRHRLRGVVDVRAWVDDPQSFRGWLRDEFSFLHDVHHPYRVRVSLRHRAGARVFARDVVRADALPRTPFRYYYAPGTRKMFASACIPERFHLRPYSCRVDYWIRLFSRADGAFWDTRAVRDGDYVLELVAWDVAGNRARKRVPVTITNG